MMTGQRRLRPLCDQIGRAGVDRVIQRFYAQVREHPHLAPYFSGIADFSAHERHIADFWWIAMGGRVPHRHSVDMVGRHAVLGLDAQAFEDWLALFRSTLNTDLPGPLGDQWYQMAAAIGGNLRRILGV